MTGSAIAMMSLAILVIWGGLGLALWNLTRYRGEEPGEVMRDL